MKISNFHLVSRTLNCSSKLLKTWNISSWMMTKLTDDILELSKIKAGVFQLNEKSFKIGSIIRDITYFFENQWEAKNISFEVRCEKEVREESFNSDEQRIKQILLNFLSNSLKFTSQGGISVNIDLYVTTDSDKVSRSLYIWVQDSGEGISDEEKSKLFKWFGRVNNSKNNKRNEKGTGLGLFLSKQLIGKFSSIYFYAKKRWKDVTF